MNTDSLELERRAQELFLQALEHAEGPERERFLAGACGDQPSLRARIEALLACHRSDSFLSQPATDIGDLGDARPFPVSPVPEAPGTVIGRYRLLQQIGEGGMGVVYMAEQEHPVRRQVALKIIKLGMDTRHVVARFEAERQALALMDHPNISKVLDAGATETGRPYFVMELVRGVPITEYCDRNHLPARERLELFIAVCHAVQHAHQKGIIHRDLKPSNVLVTLHDGVPVPKVIDFGIAKATHQRLTEKTFFTQFAQMIGTPAYMSPEQAEMSGLDIDTRSDVYSLGVLLYELLTGSTPVSDQELLRLGYAEMQRVIAAREAPRPSTRLSTMTGDERTIIAQNRSSSVGHLERLFRGDLDWIVMRSLEKDRTRRYETANALAADIRRHLNNEPVSAAAPTFGYQLRKFYRRNRPLMRLAAAAGLLGVIATLFSSWQAVRATRAERRASQLRDQAETARAAESEQRSVAEQRVYDSLVREARAVRLARKVGYRDRAFDLLQQASKITGANRNLAELRREAVACLGDFVGATPVTWTNFPDGFLLMDGTLSASGDYAALKLWKMATGESRLIIRETGSGRDCVSVDALTQTTEMAFVGSQRLAVIQIPDSAGNEFDRRRYRDASLSVWGPGTGNRWVEVSRQPIPGACRFVETPVGVLLAVDDPDHAELRLEDPLSRAVRFRFPVPETSFRPEVWIAGDGKHALLQITGAAPELRTELLLIDLPSGRIASRRQLEFTERVADVSSDGTHFMTSVPGRGKMNSYRTEGLEPVGQLSDLNVGGRASILPRQKTVAVATYLSREVRLIDFLQNETLARLDEPRNPFATCVSSDGRSLLTLGVLYARIYRLSTEPHLRPLEASVGSSGIALDPDGRHIAACRPDGSVSLLDRETTQPLWRRDDVRSSSPDFSADGRWLLLPGDQSRQRLTILDARTGVTALELGSDAFGFLSAALSRDGRYLVTTSLESGGGWDGDYLLDHDPSRGRLHAYELTTSPAHPEKLIPRLILDRPGKYCSPVFLGASTRVAMLDANIYPSAYILDLLSTNAPSVLPLEPAWSFWNLAPLPDGRSLWTIDRHGRLVLYDLDQSVVRISSVEGIDRKDFFGIQGGVISPDGRKLAVASTATRSAEIFDARAGNLLYTLPAFSSTSFLHSWTPDSRGIVVSRFNAGDAAIWDLHAIDRTLTDLGLATLEGAAPTQP